ncbi:RHS repeat-associated core domain-containing protein [Actinoplanes sp. NPDC051346]|uniref:NHL domain-containing protein n=1 Tax=Actinoplanes sp. NPDC051346 TaxID=3155048 RepID=UPI003443DEBD
MRYVLTGQVDALVGQEYREPLAGATVRLYRPSGHPSGVFSTLGSREAEARPDHLVVEAVTDDDGKVEFDFSSDTTVYDGGLLEVGLRPSSPPGRQAEPATTSAVECIVVTLSPVWQQDDNQARADWRYAIPAPTWTQLRARLAAYVITGRLSASDGAAPIVGARVKAFDFDLVQDDPLGTGLTDDDGWFRIDYEPAAFKRTPVPEVKSEPGTADVYFTADYKGQPLLAESREAGRRPDRQDVGPAFSVRLRTEARPVTISIDTPSAGRVTNQPQQPITGQVSEAAKVRLNGQPIGLDANHRFTTEVALTEGTNTLAVVAIATATGVRGERQMTVSLDTAAPASPDTTRITVTIEADGSASVAGGDGCVEPNVRVRVTNTRTGNAAEVTATAQGAFTCRVETLPGDTLDVVSIDQAENVSAAAKVAVQSALPPDPATVAPPLPATTITSLVDATAFLHTGLNPIQTGVEPGTIQPRRAAVLRGRVITPDGNPLPGVTVAILDHPEFGQTLSRADGRFDVVVNGGGRLTVTYTKADHLLAHRPADVPWQDYVEIPEVCLLPVGSAVTAIDLSVQAGMQVVRGSTATDHSGTRQATVLIPAGTRATMVFPDGREQPLSTLHVRPTEFTVGDRGPLGMPSPLPPTSGYTYAIEYSVDEAIESGAVEVRFEPPLISYTENFLGFPAGGIVPTGSYVRATGQWIPADNGRVLTVLAITSGLADLDVTGDNLADDSDVLAALGITEQERTHLAQLYSPGQQLWRIPLPHFTQPWDYNWPYGLLNEDTAPDQPEPLPLHLPDACEQSGGSILDLHNQVLREQIPVAGTPFTLCYASDRVHGQTRSLTMALSGPAIPPNLLRIELTAHVAGRETKRTFPAAPNQRHTLVFDRTDAFGRALQGAHPVVTNLGYVYNAVYLPPGEFGEFSRAFAVYSGSGGGGGNVVMIGARDRQEITLNQRWRGVLDFWTAPRAEGLGGWTLDIHHTFDPNQEILHLGDGTHRQAASSGFVITTVAGIGTGGFSGDGGPAAQADFGVPYGLAFSADGSYCIADAMNNRVRRVGPDGIITTIAGTGVAGFGGDGGPATAAQLNHPRGVATALDGSVHITDGSNHRVRRVGTDGIITTIAGTGVPGTGGDGGPATEAQLHSPHGVAVGADGSLYFADYVTSRVRRVGTDGVITTIAGAGVGVDDDEPAAESRLNSPHGVAVGKDGSVYIAETGRSKVRRIGPDGVMTTIAGTGAAGFSGDGGPAEAAQLYSPYGVAIAPDGSLYIAELNGQRVRRVGTDGTITTIAGTGSHGVNGDGGPAAAAQLFMPVAVAVDPEGSFHIAEQGSNRIRRIRTAPMAASGNSIADASLTQLVPAEDGSEAYVFDAGGRHLQTHDTLTGTITRRFHYDQHGRLAAISDRDGNNTRIERNPDGTATAITTPDGTRTQLEINAAGYLARVTDPTQAATTLGYDSGGLLTELTDPTGAASSYGYDPEGRLIRDTDVTGKSIMLARTEDDQGFAVTVLSPLLREARHRVERTAIGGERRISRCCGENESVHDLNMDGSRSMTRPDGMVYSERIGPDPRWKMQAPLLTERTATTPSGLMRRVAADRTVALTDPQNPLSLLALTDRITVSGHTLTTRFDAAARTYTATSPAGRTGTITLDALGHVKIVHAGQLMPLTIDYDPRGRPTSVTRGADGDLRTWLFRYSPQDTPSEIVDPLGRTTTLNHDAAGRITTITVPDGTVTRLGYDSAGNITTVTPPGRPTHTFQYDPNGRLAAYQPPPIPTAPEPTVLTRDADRQLTHVIRPGGRITDLNYDEAGRLSTITGGTDTIQYGYLNGTRHLASATTGDGITVAYEYDGALPTRVTWSGPVVGTLQYVYDTRFLVVAQQVGDETPIRIVRDADGILTKAGDLRVRTDPATGLRTGATLGGITDTWEHNLFGELSSHRVAHNATELYAVTYVRDLLGRIKSRQETIAGTTHLTTYDYDQRGRLQSATFDGTTMTYDYDSNGNRTGVTTNGTTLTAIYDDQDRALTYGDLTLTYGPEGELTGISTPADDTTRYGHDGLGRLIWAEVPGTTRVDYLLDATGRRVARLVNGARTSALLYDGQLHPLAELDTNNQVVTRFVYGDFDGAPGCMVRGGRTYRIVADHLGSPRLIIDSATGDITQHMDYDPWGRVIRDTQPGFQPFGFAGGLYDPATGLVQHGARDYDPDRGRWTAKDPIGFKSGQANLYAYAGGDPVNRADRTGTASVELGAGYMLYVGVKIVVTSEGFSFSWEGGAGIGASLDIDPFAELDAGGVWTFQAEVGTEVAGTGLSGKLSRRITKGPFGEIDSPHAEAKACLLAFCVKADEGGDLGLEFNLAEVAGLRSEAKMTVNYCAAAQW